MAHSRGPARWTASALLLTGALLVTTARVAALQEGPRPATGVTSTASAPSASAAAPYVGRPVRFGVVPPLRQLAERRARTLQGPQGEAAERWKAFVKTIPLRKLPGLQRPPVRSGSPDPVVQRTMFAAPTSFPLWAPEPNVSTATPAPLASFEGIRNIDNPFLVLPPDVNGDVGPNHYVEFVNVVLQVYDKATGNPLLVAPLPLSFVFQAAGFTGDCAETDDGDVIVLYDQLADRWIFSEFSITKWLNAVFAGQTPPNPFQCIAISQTGDPTGAYFVYQFQMPNNHLNDYPHWAIWPNAYFMTDHEFTDTFAFAGQGVFAFDRLKLLQGDPTAGFVYFGPTNPPPSVNMSIIGGMLCADLEGLDLPVPGTPGLCVHFRADEFGDPSDDLRVYEFHPDFSTPANSTFTLKATLPVAPFDPFVSGIPQPGTSAQLDPISDRLMHRVVYRRFPNMGLWYLRGIGRVAFGQPDDILVAPADYNGDGKDDITVVRDVGGTLNWFIMGIGTFAFGAAGDIPIGTFLAPVPPPDYDGDGKADIAVVRNMGTFLRWFIRGVGTFDFGAPGDIPVPADYNGDGKADIAVVRNMGTFLRWFIRGVGTFDFGAPGDVPVPTDYNGDGKADIAVVRNTGTLWRWFIRGVGTFDFGAPGDIPIPGDFDGDGKANLAVFRPGNVSEIVLNHTVNAAVAPASQAAIRWYMLDRNDSTGSVALGAQGTYAPDGHQRWMGSISIDRAANVCVSYTASSTTLFPSIRYACRTFNDAPGTLQAEAELQAGGGSQTDPSGRWGDYSMIGVDPTDDCTFWPVHEYYPSTSSIFWHTRFGKFKMPNCPAPTLGTLGGTVTATGPTPLPHAWVQIDVSGPSGWGYTRNVDASAHYAVSLPPGTYSVTANAPGCTPQTQSVTVSAGSPVTLDFQLNCVSDFSVSCSPTSLDANLGGSTTAHCTVRSLGTFTGTVSFSCAGLPPGVTCDPLSLTLSEPGASASGTVRVNVASTALTGPSPFSICGQSGATTHCSGHTLTIDCTLAASFDSTAKTPACGPPTGSSCGCDTEGLVISRDNIAGQSEPNQPNTIASPIISAFCPDGTLGTFHIDESIDRVEVRTTDGSPLAPGKSVEVKVTVWCFTSGAADSLDVYYTSNASDPTTFAPVQTGLPCPVGQALHTFTVPLTLANVSGRHAVRAQFRFLGSASVCTVGSFNDRDDLVFEVP